MPEVQEDESIFIQTRLLVIQYYIYTMIMFNTTFSMFLLRTNVQRGIYLILTFGAAQVICVYDLPEGALERGDSLFQFVYTAGSLIAYMIVFTWALFKMDEERIKLIICQYIETNQFKRIIDSAEEAMLIFQ